MKNLLKRVMSIAAATALLMTSVISAAAADHSHSGGTCLNEKSYTEKGSNYTITLTYPEVDGVIYNFTQANSHYGAYQIFSGTVKGEATHTNPGTESESIPITDIKWGNAFGDVASNTNAQKNVIKFVYALAKAPTGDYDYAFKDFHGFEKFFDGDDLISEYTTDTISVKDGTVSGDVSTVNFDKLAVAVADVLAYPDRADDHEWLQAFLDILGGYAQGTGGYANEAYATNFYEGFVGTGSTEVESSSSYTIYVPAGYYMIRDLSTIGDADVSHAFSARMLFVADDINQILKVDVPRLEKEILRGDTAVGGEAHETDVAGVGDNVHFQLKGTLPSNYDEYLGGYKYNFIDTLSKGLDLTTGKDGDSSLTPTSDPAVDVSDYVTVSVKGLFKWDSVDEKWKWDETATSVIKLNKSVSDHTTDIKEDAPHLSVGGDNYTIKYNKDRQLTVEFPCLKEIRIVGTADNGLARDAVYRLGYNTETKYSEIYVDYYAKVNQNAVVSPAADATQETRNGNYNKAQIEYSDNPQAYADTDKTKEDRATVYIFGLDIVKIDAAEFLRNGSYESHEDDVGLSGAKFALVRKAEANKWEIAKFSLVSAAAANALTPAPTVPSFLENGYYSIISWETIKVGGEEVTGTSFDEDWLSGYNSDTGDDGFYNITSLSDGVLNISGLDVSVEYTLVETATPGPVGDYAKIAPFTFSLTADTTTGDEYNGKLESATTESAHTVDDGKSFTFEKFVQLLDPTPENVDDNGSANMLVANFKYTDLPSTGGIGVYIYYIAGGCAVVLALVLFALSKKKRSDK